MKTIIIIERVKAREQEHRLVSEEKNSSQKHQ